MTRTVAVVGAFTFIVASGGVHGLWTSRWQQSPALANAIARLDDVPLTIGKWQGTRLAGDADVFRQTGAGGYLMRRYEVNRSTLTVILMCGPSGKMAVHTPEVCYQGAGYELLGAPATHRLKADHAREGEFLTAMFRKPSAVGASLLRIDWSWSAGGAWEAPGHPRWTFRGEPFLYKLYVVREVLPQEPHSHLPSPMSARGDGEVRGLPASEPNLEFLRQLLPVLEGTLFTPNAP